MKDGVVAVVQQLLSPARGFVAAAEGANPHMQQAIVGVLADADRVAALAQGVDQHIGIFLMRDGCDLNHRTLGRGGRLHG